MIFKESLLTSINKEILPKHIAIIMDGNGRWAKQKGEERIFGHIKGVESVQNIIQACVQIGIKYLTLYSFSTENWNRPPEEVENLMNLLAETLEKESDNLIKNDIKLKIIGDIEKLPTSTHQNIKLLIEKTNNNKGLTLIMAINYSSQWEIIHAINKISEDIIQKIILPPINNTIFEKYLTTFDLPNPELLIRTGGEKRISNFLLYQLAYAEFYFTDIFWPDFREVDLYEAIINFQNRERRFGKTSEQLKTNNNQRCY